jgi:hypothetical protein
MDFPWASEMLLVPVRDIFAHLRALPINFYSIDMSDTERRFHCRSTLSKMLN